MLSSDDSMSQGIRSGRIHLRDGPAKAGLSAQSIQMNTHWARCLIQPPLLKARHPISRVLLPSSGRLRSGVSRDQEVAVVCSYFGFCYA